MSKRSQRRALKAAQAARDGQNFLPFRLDVLQSISLAELTPYESKLLLDAMSQCRVGWNGDICLAWSVMKKRDWKSPVTLNKAIKGLLEKGHIVLTRQGGRNKCSLYGIGWLAIDECGGKLDISSTRNAINGNWRKFDAPKNES